MSAVEAQQERLPLRMVSSGQETMSDKELSKIQDFHAAIKKCVDNSGHDDKFIALDLEIDAAQWSRIKSGQANFPPSKINLLMDVCGNEIPLRWLAQSRGYGLVRLKSAVEAELEEKDRELEGLKLKLRHLEEFFKLAKT